MPTPLFGTLTTEPTVRSASFRGSGTNPAEFVADLQKLPTPMSRDYKGDTAPHERNGVVQTDSVERAIFHSGEVLLPTPTAVDGNTVAKSELDANDPKHRLKVAAQVLVRDALFPTTRARMNDASKNELAAGNPYGRIEVEARLVETNWGKFEPAIRRWEEVLGRPAPLPTKPDGKDGAHRLSSAFTEWMMGVPEGWITDVGLSRNDELKACGNGVVPQQAALALRALLEGITLPRGGGQVNLPTPTVSDTFTDNLASTQQKEGSMHSVTLPQAVRMVSDRINEDSPR